MKDSFDQNRPSNRPAAQMRDSGARRLGDPAERSIGAPTRFMIGTEVVARDAVCGELNAVILDPVAQALTHLVVAPKHHGGLGRLVPVELVASDDGEQISLSCDAAHFHALEDSEEIDALPAGSNVWGYGTGQAYAWPHYGGIGAGGMGMGLGGGPQALVTERVPAGEIKVRRGDHVHASDGWIGSVQGLVIDPADHHVTHVLLQEGPMWGRKQVAIPIGATTRVEDAIRVELTKRQVQDLPSVELSSSP
jgi:sporulation protein YlmC with PRC-barrel domain